MKAIVIVDKNWNIGYNGQLLAHISRDLKYFKEKTEGKAIVYGRKTLDSFPGGKPLPNRENIILTNNPNYKKEGVRVCVGEEAFLATLKEYPADDVFLAGGSSIYKQFLNLCSEVLVTKIDKAFVADSGFPNLDAGEEFSLVCESEYFEEKGIRFKFTRYERKKEK